MFDRKSNAARKRGAEPAQHRIALGRRDQDVLIRDVGDGPDDGQHAVELRHADLAFDHGDAVLSGFLGVPEGGDGAAEQDQSLGDIAPGRLETLLVAVPCPAEQVPMYFSNMASVASVSRVSRLAAWTTRIAVRRAGSRSAMCWTVMIAPSSINRARRAAWMRPARAGSIPSPRAYSRRSSSATMLEGAGDSE